MIGSQPPYCQGARTYTAPVPDANAASLRAAFLARVDDAARGAIERLTAAAAGTRLYVAGGAVRDLLLGRPLQDIDLSVEGNAPALARIAFPSGPVKAYARFGTAMVRGGRARIDLVTARRETYVRPGALPHTEPGSIDDDLRRRDFPIDAMALSLTGEPAFLDPCGGRADLERRVVRVLHDRSFIDDPTRIFRAFRYATRLAFDVEPHTRALIDDALGYIAAVSGERLRRELELALGEAMASGVLRALDDAGALRALHPALVWPTHPDAALERAQDAETRLATGFALLALNASPGEAEEVVVRLRLRRAEATAVRGVVTLRASAHLLQRPQVKPSGVVVLLDGVPRASVAAFAATTEDPIAGPLALRYLDEWAHVQPVLNGDDLIAMGVPEGPQVRRGLQLVRAARLDGTALDEADERILVLRFAKSIRDAGAMTRPLELHDDGR